MITMKNVQKTYSTNHGTLHVLKGIHLSIERGEMIAVMGRSGVGKSTLLHLLSGLERPTEGEIFIDHIRVDQLSKANAAKWRKQKIGYVLQKDALIEEFTVYENIALPLKYAYKTKQEIDERVKTLLEALNLTEKQHE